MLFPQISISQNLSENSQISIITCGPGHELYSTFGHSAIRVRDDDNKMDCVFNYGTFNFDDPHFYSKFIKGKLKYFLSVSDFTDFLKIYIKEDRYVHEQVLAMNPDDRNKVFAYLSNNSKPENRYYLYDFFYDNCSTREISLLKEVLGTRLILPENISDKTDKSFRDLIEPHLQNLPWGNLGISLGLGSETDKPVTEYQKSFLPFHLKTILDETMIADEKGIRPLVSKNNILYEPEALQAEPVFMSPVAFFWIVFIILSFLTLHEYRNKIHYKFVDACIFITVGMLGSLLLFLWFMTDHKATENNYNMIWALPTHLLFGATLVLRPGSTINTFYAITNLFILCGFLLFLSAIEQKFHIAIFPIILTLALRHIFYIVMKQSKRQGFNIGQASLS